MIETPRAALRADEIAEEADFFSFGTNDLTQMTFGFSRDDVESRMMPAYLEQGLLKRNPFETIDADGVGELVRIGAAARPRRPSPTSSSACAASTAATPSRSPCSTTPASTTCQLLAVPGADRPPGGGPGRSLGADGSDTTLDLIAASLADAAASELRRPRRRAVALGRAARRSSSALLLVDLLVLHREAARRHGRRRRPSRSAVWIAIGLAFGARRRGLASAARRPASTSPAT